MNPIDAALAWLDENEPLWGLEVPIDRGEFVADLQRRMQVTHHNGDATIGLNGVGIGAEQAKI